MSLPPTSTRPVSASSSPASTRSAVVLPQPDGPSSATSSPGAMSRSRPSSAWTPPKLRRSPSSRTATLFVVLTRVRHERSPMDSLAIKLGATAALG